MNEFFALMNRMKFIERWGLMNSTRPENVMEHSALTAMLAHALCLLENKLFGGGYNPERAALLGLYHESAEVLTGDLPTPVKYFNDSITTAYKAIEQEAERRICARLPQTLKTDMEGLISQDKGEREYAMVKAADKLAALIKCVEETKAGNDEFKRAYSATLKSLKESGFKSVDYFLKEMLPAFAMNLDEYFSPLEE